MSPPYLPAEAEVIERVQECRGVFTLRLGLSDAQARARYGFGPGQFNMVYLYGVGEVPISIVSDPEDAHLLDHTIRALGRVTRGLVALKAGERLGLRGPYGRGWPLVEAEGRDVVLVTGGLGCAPVVSVINYILRRRERFGRLVVMQGVKHTNDLIWREKYEQWARLPHTQVLLASDEGAPNWPYQVGVVTVLFDQAEIHWEEAIVMMCGPERMMQAAARDLIGRGVPETSLWLSMERNMQCAVGHCGHCQYGGRFVCKDGPVFPYLDVKPLFGHAGF